MLDLLLRIVASVLVPLFIGGMALSAVVVAMTLFRDLLDFRTTPDEQSAQSADNL